MAMSMAVNWLAFVLIPGILGILVMGFVYRGYLRIQTRQAMLLAFVALAAGVAILWGSGGRILERSPLMAYRTQVMESGPRYSSMVYGPTGFTQVMVGFSFLMTVALAVALVAKLYRAWLMEVMTPGEWQAGGKGVRAWLGPVNSLVGLGIVAGAYVGMGWSPWSTAAVVVALLLSYPLLHAIGNGAVKLEEGAELAEERRRVLALVEAGKITGADGAELIAALGQSRVAGPEDRARLSGAKRWMLAGAAVLLVGFFLPWFEVNTGALLREALVKMHRMEPTSLQVPTLSGSDVPTIPGTGLGAPIYFRDGAQNEVEDIVVAVRAGELRFGLGWVILGMGIAAAVLPLLWPTDGGNRAIQRGLTLGGMIVGSVILIYQVTDVMGGSGAVRVAVGLFLAMVGYGILWAGALREYVRLGVRGGMGAVVGSHG